MEPNVTTEANPLILDLVEWVATGPRPYAEVMEIWRTSCPRLTIWEDAVEPGLVVREHDESNGAMVKVTPSGRSLLMEKGRLPNSDPKSSGEHRS
jgi:hypothetical protein